MLKRIAAGGVAAVIGVGAWGIAGEDNSTRDETGSIVASGEVGAFVTRVGDCFESLSDESTVTTVPGVPCSTAHHWQVFHKEDSALTEFDADLLDQEVVAVCDAALEDLVYGMSDDTFNTYETSETTYFFPLAESWAEGDRTIDCLQGSDTVTYFQSILD
jgi:hypothetical protein